MLVGQLLTALTASDPEWNAAGPLVTGATRYKRMMPILHSLHWLLRVWQRITFKTAVSVYTCLHARPGADVPDRELHIDTI